MDINIITAVIIISSFFLSYLFALGGVGAAIALIPLLDWLGVPFNVAKSIGLLTNTLSLSGASYFNIKNKNLDFTVAIPIIISSCIFSPLGAWSSHFISQKIGLILFILFLCFSSGMLFFFNKVKVSTIYRKELPLIFTSLIGAIAGIISGLLGVGGGSLISPVLIFYGFNPKKVASITAFVVPLSSFIGFITYIAMGKINWNILILAAGASYLGGYSGTKQMQKKMNSQMIRKLLGGLLFIIAIKLIFKII